MKNSIVGFAFMAMLATVPALAQSATLEFLWKLPAALDDAAKTPLAASDVSNCKIYEATTAGVPSNPAGPVAVISKPATGNVPEATSLLSVTGTKRYVLTCTAFGNESEPSNMVLVTASKPGKVTTFQVRVVFTASPGT